MPLSSLFNANKLGKVNQLKALPLPCLMTFRPPMSCPLSASSRVFSSLLFSHSLSGRAICEGAVQHHSAPAEASGSSGYNSEWISISSGRLITMRNRVRVSVPLFPWGHLRVTMSAVARSWVGLAFACVLAAFAWQEWTRIWVFAVGNYDVIQFPANTASVRNHFDSGLRNSTAPYGVGFP